jgi:putative salt-induced outer membrane protein YdiY
MMCNRPNYRLLLWALGCAIFALVNSVQAQSVILHLRTGDRIAGTIVSETTNSLTISNLWIKELAVPLAQIERREAILTNAPATATTNAISSTAATSTTTNQPSVTTPGTNAVVVAKSGSVITTNTPPAPLKPSWWKRWKGDASIGTDLIYGARDTELLRGHLALTYSQPYQSDPKKFFRNVLTYDAEYGQTDHVLSANRMDGSSKTDFDLTKRVYVYNLARAGYDEVRKIDFGYEVGPGAGYHLFTLTNFVMNVELGGNYQAQYFADRTTSKNFYLRLAEDFNWKINKQMSLVEKLEFFPQVNNIDQYRARFETTFSQSLFANFSLNLTLLNLYDTHPASGVSRNEVQIRSSIGVKF